MRQKVEANLIDLWRNGEFSMHNIQQITEALGVWVRDKIKEASENVVKIREGIPAQEEKVSANNKEYSNVGVLSRSMMGSTKICSLPTPKF